MLPIHLVGQCDGYDTHHMGHVITRLELETKFAKIEVSQLQSTEAWILEGALPV